MYIHEANSDYRLHTDILIPGFLSSLKWPWIKIYIVLCYLKLSMSINNCKRDQSYICRLCWAVNGLWKKETININYLFNSVLFISYRVVVNGIMSHELSLAGCEVIIVCYKSPGNIMLQVIMRFKLLIQCCFYDNYLKIDSGKAN